MNLSSRSTQIDAQKHASSARFKTAFFAVLLVIILCPALLCGVVLSAFWVSEPLARSMTPPTYPNSQMTGVENATGAWGYTEFHRYSTTDNIAKVDNWYRTNAPNLKRIQMETGGIEFDNPASDSLLVHIVGYLNSADWGSGPNAGLTIYPDAKNPGVTQITVSIAWPSP